MSGFGKYLKAAFNARPFAMPIPPNWFLLAAFGLLGWFIDPGLWVVGGGIELAYLGLLAGNPRFKAAVDANERRSDTADEYQQLLSRVSSQAKRQQSELEKRCADIVHHLNSIGATATQVDGVTQLCWLHLRLLAARESVAEVMEVAIRDHDELVAAQSRIAEQLRDESLDTDLRRSLEQRGDVIATRLEAHAAAQQRLTLLDSELQRIRQQAALVQEQALLASDEDGITRSVDVLAASLNEANRWLREQRELFSDLQDVTGERPPPALISKVKRTRKRQRRAEESA